MEFVTDLWGAVTIVPAAIVILTQWFKSFLPKWSIFLIPSMIGICFWLLLFLAFNEYSVGVYILNWLFYGLWGQFTREAAKWTIKSEWDPTALFTNESDLRWTPE